MNKIEQELADELTAKVPAVVEGAGEILAGYFRKNIGTEHKGQVDLVTAADREAEAHLCSELPKLFPDIAIIAEEGGAYSGKVGGDLLWYIDPLDGTTNFAHNFPIYAISVGLCKTDAEGVPHPVYGFVLIPGLGAFYHGGPDHGSFKNGDRIECSAKTKLSESLAVTGFPYNRREIWPALAANIEKVIFHCRGVRRTGSACSDLCLVAESAVDLYYEAHLSPWDLAAGIAIARGAGAQVSDMAGGTPDIRQGNIIASGPGVHAELLELGLVTG